MKVDLVTTKRTGRYKKGDPRRVEPRHAKILTALGYAVPAEKVKVVKKETKDKGQYMRRDMMAEPRTVETPQKIFTGYKP